ncbi:hypothetical protein ANTQUA_LOCUS5611 [Anthophora quadrimaculata]
MTDLNVEDTLTKLNTQLNKSMVLMDTTTEMESPQPKSNKSIKISTKVQPASPYSASSKPRKSILKNTERKSIVEMEQNTKNIKQTLKTKRNSTNVPHRRPHNIDDLVQEEGLIVENTDSIFSLSDLSDSEDIWIMDVPATIDPKKLKGQTLMFGDKSKFKVNEEKYYAVNHEVKCNITCVLKTDNKKSHYKTVNIKPAGAITVRRKLSSISKIKPMQIENYSVPFPKNLRIRHPFFGVNHKGKFREVQ